MPVTQQTSTQFQPQGMQAYSNLTPQMASVLQQYMQDPLKASYFNSQVGMANKSIGQQGQSQMQTLLNNARQFGGGAGGNNPYLASQMAMQGRAQSGQKAGAFNSLLMGAQQNRQWATGAAAGYQPLSTGQTQTETGLGSWLPQVAGGILGALGSGLFGGGSSIPGNGMANSLSGGAQLLQSPFLNGAFGPPQITNGLLPQIQQ
jgi:hypothetical protein